MPITYRIIPARNLVYVACHAHISVGESQAAFRAYLADAEFRAGQRHLIDVSRCLGYGEGAHDAMELNARLADALPMGDETLIMAYYAPTQVGLEMAQNAQRSWSQIPFARVVLASDERRLMEILGLPERGIDELLALAM